MAKMIKGLKLLSQSDPFVEVFQQQTGEWVILGAGELHLEVIISSFKRSDHAKYIISEVFEGPTRKIC
jgi:translation elongation factor EF-G